jgi:hypothetical protein
MRPSKRWHVGDDMWGELNTMDLLKCREEKQMANDMGNYEMSGKIRVA